MKRHDFFLGLLLILGVIFMSTSPYVPSYGGKIQVTNNSSYNLFFVLKTNEDTEKMLCTEKNETVIINHSFEGAYRKELANPANYYTSISLYDFDSGILLKKLNVNSGIFVLKSGSIDSNNALFEFTINDDLLEGGL